MANILRNIPSVNELLDSPPLRDLMGRVNRNVVVNNVRNFLQNLRDEAQTKAAEFHLPDPSELAQHIAQWILQEERLPLRPVINATGIILHTGLGRAPLAQEALQAIAEISSGYASLEVDLDSGERSQRVRAVERLLTQVTGAEAAAVVNNNAGATLLTLAALASGREVIVSRGQLIEIGGSYRLPEVMSASGAILKEVGTTNKTRGSDYERAIGENTGALLRVHTSNYVVVGFAEQPTLEDLVSLGRRHNLPVIDDIGSGALVDFSRFGLGEEPIAGDSLKAGADLVLFSGDKLLGGPQCGIILGRTSLVHKITHHPLMRALRVDKMTLAALAATLRLYQDPEKAQQTIPLLSLVSASVENLKNRAERLAPQLAASPAVAATDVFAATTYLGGGSVPGQQLATWCVGLRPSKLSVDAFARALRTHTTPVFARVQKEQVILDLRSVLPNQDLLLAEAVQTVNVPV